MNTYVNKSYQVTRVIRMVHYTIKYEPSNLEQSDQVIKLLRHIPENKSNYLDHLILKAKACWKNVDPDKWLHDLRGDYEA